MTPTRVKRASKAPERFSSDTQRHETVNTDDDSVIYRDESTTTSNSSVTQNIIPATNKTIKLKSVSREPLKVKLPKLKRIQQSQTSNNDSIKNKLDDVKIRKIKLPSLNIKRQTSNQEHKLTKPKGKKETKSSDPHLEVVNKVKIVKHVNDVQGTNYLDDKQNASYLNDSNTTESQSNTSQLEYPKNLSPEKVSSANSSFSSSEESASTRMEILVTKTETPPTSGIRCPCGVDDDLGVMVECESCSTWQHGHCINVGTEEDAYEGYLCAHCTLPKEAVRNSLHLLALNDTFHNRFDEFLKVKGQNDTRQDGTTMASPFSLDELCQSIKVLNRVFESLLVKWRLLTNSNYEAELRIWQNPFWSPEPQENQIGYRNLYFLDRCKTNLKLNIRNIINKMDQRLQLIAYAYSLLPPQHINSDSQTSIFIRHSMEKINAKLDEFRIKIKSIPN